MSFIKTIKTGQGVLGWDDDVYRSVLMRITGKTSATKLTPIEAEKVIKYMRSVGFNKSSRIGKKPTAQVGGEQILSKIEAILTDCKLPWAYAERMSQNMFKSAIEKLNDKQLHSVLKALIYHQKRKQ